MTGSFFFSQCRKMNENRLQRRVRSTHQFHSFIRYFFDFVFGLTHRVVEMNRPTILFVYGKMRLLCENYVIHFGVIFMPPSRKPCSAKTRRWNYSLGAHTQTHQTKVFQWHKGDMKWKWNKQQKWHQIKPLKVANIQNKMSVSIRSKSCSGNVSLSSACDELSHTDRHKRPRAFWVVVLISTSKRST